MQWSFSPHSGNQERLLRRGCLRERSPSEDGPLKAEGSVRGGDRFVTSDSTEAVKVQLPVRPSHVSFWSFMCKCVCG